MRLPLNGLARRSRWLSVAAVTTALALAAAAFAPAAHAGGPDTTLCHMNASRVKIPSNFTVDACFDGTILTLRNRTSATLRVYAVGDIQRGIRNADSPNLASLLTTISTDTDVLPPSSYLQLWLGSGATDIEMEVDTQANFRYDLSELLIGYIPGAPGAIVGVWTDIASAVEDILAEFAARARCAAGASWLKGIECAAGMGESILRTSNELFLKLGLDVAKVGLLTGALINTVWYLYSDSEGQASDLKAIAGSTPTLHIVAAPGSTSQGANPGSSNPGSSKPGGSRPAAGPASATASNSDGQLLVQLANFPLGTTYYFCHSGTGYPTGGTIASNGSVNITSPNENLGALCSGSGNFWIGFQGTDGHDYYSNQVTLATANPPPPAATAATATASGGQLLVQLANFPLGTTYYFCHSGTGYPTGGTIASHSSVNITSPNENLGALCSGSGNFWIGFQGTDGHDYYSNQVTLG
jgi:hypothetical protein